MDANLSLLLARSIIPSYNALTSNRWKVNRSLSRWNESHINWNVWYCLAGWLVCVCFAVRSVYHNCDAFFAILSISIWVEIIDRFCCFGCFFSLYSLPFIINITCACVCVEQKEPHCIEKKKKKKKKPNKQTVSLYCRLSISCQF